MTLKIRQLFNTINHVLTLINFFLIGIITLGGIPKKLQEAKIPLIANCMLLVAIVFFIVLYISGINNQETYN